MVRKLDLGTIIVLDIGRNVSEPAKGRSKSFFEEARECTARIIERKIMSKAKNMLGVLLLGASKTKNKMADDCPGAFKRIEVLYELQDPCWKMIRDLPEKATTSKADWMDGLAVAAERLLTCETTFTLRKIILMTNFLTPTGHTEENFKQMLDGFKDANIEVDVIGPDIYNENFKTEDVEIARLFVESTNGATASFDDTLSYLLFHRRRNMTSMPWNVELAIGPNIRIPVSAYKKLEDGPVVDRWQKAIKDPVTGTSSSTEGIVREKVHVNVENQTVVEPTEVIKGVSYGQKIIPFSTCDKAMLYEPGEKCLSVYGFTHTSNITWQNMTGDCLYYVFGKKGDKKAQSAIRCLAECLHKNNLVGVARRVYNKGNAPKMFALMPVIDTNNYVCLSMVAICYKEEIKNMAFPPTNLKKHAVSDEQVNAFKRLIKAMDLMKAYNDNYDDSEAFPVAETVSPTFQYVMDCIAYRAMNPGKPLPPPREEIMTLFNCPPLVEDRAREPLEKIKTLFPLKEVEVKSRRKKDPVPNDAAIDDNLPSTSAQIQANGGHNDIPCIQLPVRKEKVVRIGTTDPVSDFKTLMKEGKTLAELSPEMTDAIESLVYCNIDGNYTKAFNAIKFFREQCVNSEPCHYNDWLNVFRSALMERKKQDFITLLGEKKLGLILKYENVISPYEIDDCEDNQLYDNDTIPSTAELTIRSDINAMYDDL